MGLTESAQSKGCTTSSSGWGGPTKSRSTPHFPDGGRQYQSRPRQAATLPARPTPESGEAPPYSRTPLHHPQPMGHDPRPPETPTHSREGQYQAGRNSGLRLVPPRRSASADSRKRRSDPLLDTKTMQQFQQILPVEGDSRPPSATPEARASTPTSPLRVSSRPRPTAIYLADDDQVDQLVRHREARSRDRRTVGREPRRGSQETARRESVDRRHQQQQQQHVSTLMVVPQCRSEAANQVGEQQPQVTPRHQKRKKKNKSRNKNSEGIHSEKLQGDPYVGLHYGGTLSGGRGQKVQHVTAWGTEVVVQGERQPEVPPNTQLAQVVIPIMNQVSASSLDNYDAVNANTEGVQVRRNVWFHANRTDDDGRGNHMSRRTNKSISVAAIDEDLNETRLPSYSSSSKVSCVYMRPEMHIAAVSCIREGHEMVTYKAPDPVLPPAVRHRTKPHRLSSTSFTAGTTSSARMEANRLEKTPGMYDDKREYLKAPGRRKKRSSLAIFNSGEKGNLESVPAAFTTPPAFADVPEIAAVRDEQSAVNRENNREKDKVMNYQIHMPAAELKYGLRSHVEDFTIIEDSTGDTSHYYGCKDSDQEEEEKEEKDKRKEAWKEIVPSKERSNESLFRAEEVVECADEQDNTTSACDNTDKDSFTLDSITAAVNSSLYTSFTAEPPWETLMVARPTGHEEVFNDLDLTVTQDSVCDGGSQVILSPDSLRGTKVFPDSSLRHRYGVDSSEMLLEKKCQSNLVPGFFPSALLPNHQKCLSKSTSLPRQFHTSWNLDASFEPAEDKMRAFRNRLRSFDMGNFPVLRLPLGGNQPRLVDILRASSSLDQNPADSFRKKATEHDIPSQELCGGESQLPTAQEAPDENKSPQGHHTNESVSYLECNTCEANVAVAGSLPEDNGDCDAISVAQSGGGQVRAGLEAVPSNYSTQHHLWDEGRSHQTAWEENSQELLEGSSSSVADSETDVGNDDDDSEESDNEDDFGETGTLKRCEAIGYNLSGTVKRASVVSRDSSTWHSCNGTPASSDGDNVTPCKSSNDSCQGQDGGGVGAPDWCPRAVPDIIPPGAGPIRKRLGSRVARPSVHMICWDTPVSTSFSSADCSYLCHEQCQDLVTLDCKTDLSPDSHTSHEDLYVETADELLQPDPQYNNTLRINENHSNSQEEEEEEEEECEEENEEREIDEEEKHVEEQQEKEFKEDTLKITEVVHEVSTLRKSVTRLQSHLVDNETLEAWVEKYNASAQGLQIAKENDGSYRGCIRVHLNLSRPINIVAGTRPPSIYDILQEDRTMEKTLTSFYMPRDAVKAIHITSKTTTREVIIALLRKFKVVDNPQKFALYERTYDTTQCAKARLRRLGDSECPLVLALTWSAGGLTNKRLVLQENDTADIQWEAFSLPELSNFLRILDREEEEYRCQIQDKYSLLRRRIGNLMNQSSNDNRC